MKEHGGISSNPSSHSGPRPLYPRSIAFLIEERPLLWYESADDYDELRREVFTELSPNGALECVFVKNLVDYIWELRRMKKMKHVAINFVMPKAATDLLEPDKGMWGNPERDKVMEQATDIAYGAEEDLVDDTPSLSERMEEMRLTSEMVHYRALNEAADHLQRINRECERLEGRFHHLLKDFETRRSTLAAMAKSLIRRERAEDVAFKEVS